jgi:hypothetical protein
MSKIAHVLVTLDVPCKLTYVSVEDLKKICSVVVKDNHAILGRHGTNKSVLKKLLGEER